MALTDFFILLRTLRSASRAYKTQSTVLKRDTHTHTQKNQEGNGFSIGLLETIELMRALLNQISKA